MVSWTSEQRTILRMPPLAFPADVYWVYTLRVLGVPVFRVWRQTDERRA